MQSCTEWEWAGSKFTNTTCDVVGSVIRPQNFQEYAGQNDGYGLMTLSVRSGVNPNQRDIRNKTTDPCISKTVDSALKANKDVVGAIADIIKKFDASKTVEINVFDGHVYKTDAYGNFILDQNGDKISKPGKTTNQILYSDGRFSADITLSIEYHDGTSKENLVTSMIHEIVHAYLGYTSNNFLKTETDHNVIANKYITPMATYLQSYFGIDIKDAYALAWSGVSDSKVYNENTPNETEFTMSDGKKITVGEINTIAGAYKLSTKVLSNHGYTKGKKICD